MQRNNTTGGLASLTANYTDSDASDSENENSDPEIESELETQNSNHVNSNNVQTSTLTNEVTNNLNIEQQTESNTGTNSISEMGHITDEEQSDEPSDRNEIEDDDEDYAYHLRVTKSKDTQNEDVQIPPEPPGWCSKQLQEKIAEKYERMVREGIDLNHTIQNQKQFRNPSIYEKLIQFCQIDELGTNYSAETFDPKQFDSSSYYEELAKTQKTEMERRQKEPREKTKIEFISGTKKLTSSASDQKDENKKRKSKWDVAASNVIIGPQPKPVGILPQASIIPLTAAVASNSSKATVISAFGTIVKKAKP